MCLCVRRWQYGIGQLNLKYLCAPPNYWLMGHHRLTQCFCLIVTIIVLHYFYFLIIN